MIWTILIYLLIWTVLSFGILWLFPDILTVKALWKKLLFVTLTLPGWFVAFALYKIFNL